MGPENKEFPTFSDPQIFFKIRALKFYHSVGMSSQTRPKKSTSNFMNFLKNVLEDQNGLKFLRRPNLTYCKI